MHIYTTAWAWTQKDLSSSWINLSTCICTANWGNGAPKLQNFPIHQNDTFRKLLLFWTLSLCGLSYGA